MISFDSSATCTFGRSRFDILLLCPSDPFPAVCTLGRPQLPPSAHPLLRLPLTRITLARSHHRFHTHPITLMPSRYQAPRFFLQGPLWRPRDPFLNRSAAPSLRLVVLGRPTSQSIIHRVLMGSYGASLECPKREEALFWDQALMWGAKLSGPETLQGLIRQEALSTA
jgi:hypothetical protein